MRFSPGIPVFGDITYRGDCNSEAAEQKDFFGRLKVRHPDIYTLAVHPKNEGKRTGRQQTSDRELGAMNTGASDIIVPGLPCFVCEMKRADHTKSTITKEQINYLKSSQKMGAFACIALGADGAESALEYWLRKYYPDIQK